MTPLELVESEHEWLFKEEVHQRGPDKPGFSQRGAILVESDEPLTIELEGRTLYVGVQEFDLGHDWGEER